MLVQVRAANALHSCFRLTPLSAALKKPRGRPPKHRRFVEMVPDVAEDTSALTVSAAAPAARKPVCRRTNFAANSEAHENLAAAIAEAKASEKPNISQIAETYGVKRSTLIRRLKMADPLSCQKRGAKPNLPPPMEKEIATYVRLRHQFQFPLKRKSLRETSKVLAEEFNIDDHHASRQWLKRFLARHSLVLKTEQKLEPHRVANMNPQLVDEYFEVLGNAFDQAQKLSGGIPISPDRIFNLDETGIHRRKGRSSDVIVVPSECRRNRARNTMPEVEWHVSMLNVIFADGSSLPPYFVMPGHNRPSPSSQKVDQHGRLFGVQVGCDFGVTENGYMTEELWEKHAVPWLIRSIRARVTDPTLWVVGVLDGYSAHTTGYESLRALRNARVLVVSLVSHTSADLQPLDVSVYRYVRLCLVLHCSAKSLTIEHFVRLGPSSRPSKKISNMLSTRNGR